MSSMAELRAWQKEYQRASIDRRRTMRQQIEIEQGRHPATKMPLADSAETCGSCGNAVKRTWRSKSFWKCALMPETHGPGTDIRLKWPACTKWIPTPDSTGGMTIDELLP